MSLTVRSALALVLLGLLTDQASGQLLGNHPTSDGGLSVDPVQGPGLTVSGSGGVGFGSGGFFYQPGQFRSFGQFSPYPRGQFGPPPAFQSWGGPGGMRLPYHQEVPNTNPSASSRSSTNSTRADDLIELGDRAFRGGNFHRAEERYKLAAKLNQESPTPHIHLAQIALIRGEYGAAAVSLRDAIATTRDHSWLMAAPDIQAMYGEPADFARQLAKLESYLQTHPDDRNAWFVLGAENHFSNHYQVASDLFLRLTDRPPDEALAAFLRAATKANRQATTAEVAGSP